MQEQNQKIHRYIIKSAPYGELSQVLKDLQKVSMVDLTSPHISEAIQKYNEQHLALFYKSPQSLLVMPVARNGQNQYVNHLQRTTYTVDYISHQIVGKQEAAIDLPQPVQVLLKELNNILGNYVKSYYREPCGQNIYMDISQETGLTVHIGITGKNVNLANFYTGEWISYWQVTKDRIRGEVSVNAHYFEAGNVQLHQKKKTQAQFQFSEDMNVSAKKIVKYIQNFEAKVQQGLGEIYEKMPQVFFKNLRRVAPMTGTKMNWNINSIIMNKNLMQFTNK